jgi:transmembrane sensor
VPAPAVPPHAARATQRPRRRAGLRRWLHVAAVVGVLAVGVSLGWRAFSPVPAQVYASAIGERRVLQLADGSQVVLAPRSRISVAFSAGARDVDLVSGEADFQVAHDRARPFRVHAGPSIIQAVGTRFSVNRLPSGTVVSVSEGKVRMLAGGAGGLKAGLKAGMKAWLGRDEPAPVASRAARPLDPNASLKAGQAVKIALSGQAFAAVDYASTVDASAALPRLTFHEDTLADIVAEFNRYNPRQIVVADSAIRWQRYSGVFNANDADSFLQFLECCSSLAVIRDGEQTQVRARE